MTDDPRERAEQRTLILPRVDQGPALRPGTLRQEYRVERTLGVGGFSIVYLARDTKLDRRVALKEYLPATLASRLPGGDVAPRLPRFEELFQSGLQGFMNEARLLGSFDHPGLVKVFRFWPEAGSAYMAMPYYDGITLKKWLADLGASPSEAWLRQLVDPLMQALQVLHDARCLHRDVSPDNILMQRTAGGGGSFLEQRPHPVLLDFSAARRVIGDATQNLTSILKSGYSPIEQYEGEQSRHQGPWTDVYALCAVLYTAAVGRSPGSSVARVVRDDLIPAREAAKGRYSPRFLDAIDAGLAVRPERRPRNMVELRHWLGAPGDAPLPAAPARAAARPPAPPVAAAAGPSGAAAGEGQAASPSTGRARGLKRVQGRTLALLVALAVLAAAAAVALKLLM